MPTHWTYGEFKPGDDLAQGDIIQLTPDIRNILDAAHKHFLDPKYAAFIILTQSCDMVRRDGLQCKSRYINLAVVRPLEDVLTSFLETECNRVKIENKSIEGSFISEDKIRAINMVSRIVNQNEHGLGLFYLHDDADVGIALPSVAMLQVSIALRREHYDKLVAARSGRLNSEFQSRLGWIMGNLFSRVATKDWESKKKKALVNSILGNIEGLYWIPQATVLNAQKGNFEIEKMTVEQIVLEIKKHQPQPSITIAISQVLSILNDVSPSMQPADIEKFRNMLANDQKLVSLFKNI